MSIKSFRPLLEVAVLGVAAFAIHYLIYFFAEVKTDDFTYSIADIYMCFLAASLFTTLIVVFVRQKSIDSVGSTMMLLTVGKMVPAYMIMSPALEGKDTPTEKVNFLIVFAVFLIIDTVVAIRILNSK